MSTNTTVYVGAFLECVTTPLKIKYTFGQCPRDPKHEVVEGKLFCPDCGAQVHTKEGTKQEDPLFYDVFEALSKADQKFINSHQLTFVDPSWVGYDAEEPTHILMCRHALIIDAPWVWTSRLGDASKAPSAKDIAKIKRIMQYKSVKVRTGILVQEG